MATIRELGRPALELTNGQLAIVTVARLALTTAFRIVYPLQPFLALQLDADLQTVSALITVQLAAGLASPLGGVLADTRGERATMLLGLAVFCAGALTCALAGGFGGFLAGYLLVGLAMSLYLPAAQAYLSRRTPYEHRARTLGLFETSWAAAALVGVAPLMQLVDTTGRLAPVFWALLAFGLASLALMALALPPAAPRSAAGQARPVDWRALRSRSVAATLLMWLLLMFAYDLFGVVQGAWLQLDFGADEARLGQLFALIGVAELAGSLLVAVVADRFGKRRAVAAGLVITAACMATLPLTSGRWDLFVPLYFGFFFALEFAIVAAIPLTTTVAPAARGTLMALAILTNGLGRVAGSLLAERLREAAGIGANALLGAGLMLLAALMLAQVREAERRDEA